VIRARCKRRIAPRGLYPFADLPGPDDRRRRHNGWLNPALLLSTRHGEVRDTTRHEPQSYDDPARISTLTSKSEEAPPRLGPRRLSYSATSGHCGRAIVFLGCEA